MIVQVMLILFGALALVALLGLITRVLEGAPREWKTLHALHPSPEGQPGPGAKEMRVYATSTDPRVRTLRPITVRYVVDEDALRAWPVSIRGGAGLGIAVPWAAAEIGEVAPTPFGPHAPVRIEDVVLLVPEKAIEAELAIRAELREAAADPMTEQLREPLT